MNSVVTTYIVIPFIVVPQLLFGGVMIRFDRLNNLVNHPGYVPIIGEMMTSRWAFEAMAVHQFKGNKFTREFFEIDQSWKNAAFQSDRISSIQGYLNEIHFEFLDDEDLYKSGEEFALIRNELDDLQEMNVVASFGDISLMDPEYYHEGVYKVTTDSLHKAREYFKRLRSYYDKQSDALSKSLIKQWGGKEQFLIMRKTYSNQRLEDVMLNKNQFVVEWNNRLVRKTSPIYQHPSSKMGRAQFFAPTKRVGKHSFDTFWFNLAIIWLSTLLFYTTLVFDLLRKFINWNHSRRLSRNK